MRSLSSPCKKSQGMRQAYQSNRDTHFLQYTNKNFLKKTKAIGKDKSAVCSELKRHCNSRGAYDDAHIKMLSEVGKEHLVYNFFF